MPRRRCLMMPARACYALRRCLMLPRALIYFMPRATCLMPREARLRRVHRARRCRAPEARESACRASDMPPGCRYTTAATAMPASAVCHYDAMLPLLISLSLLSRCHAITLMLMRRRGVMLRRCCRFIFITRYAVYFAAAIAAAFAVLLA